MYDFIKPSITEPLLFGVDFKLLSAHGSMEYFDPKLAIQNKEKFSLRAVKFDTSKLGGTSFNQYFINVGGWLHYAAFKRVLGYYQIAKQQKYEGKSNPGKRFIYLNSFGRHGASTRFSPMLINDYFTRNQDGTQPGYVSSSSPYANFHKQRLRHGAADNIASYYYGLYDFENVFKRKLESSETINLKSTHVGYNWDVTQNKILGLMRLPGAMLRHSRRLLMLSINHTRSQLDINIESEADHVLCRVKFGSSCEPAKVGNSFGWTFDSQKDRNYYQTAPWPNWLFEKLQNKASSYKN